MNDKGDLEEQKTPSLTSNGEEETSENHADTKDESPSGRRNGCNGHSISSRNAWRSVLSINCAITFLSLNAIGSIGSLNSIFSALSLNSAFSILSVNSAFAVGCTKESFKICWGDHQQVREETSSIASVATNDKDDTLDTTNTATSTTTTTSTTQGTALSSGLDVAGFDTSVSPKDDLYEHVNGGWINHTEIPADESSWSMFSLLREESSEKVRALVEEISRLESTDAATQKVRDFYNSYINHWEEATERGLEAIRSDLNNIQNARTLDDVIQLWAQQMFTGVESPIGAYVSGDPQDPNTMAVFLAQSGETLPDREYYLSNETSFTNAREVFFNYTVSIFEKLYTGDSQGDVDEEKAKTNATATAESILAFETRLAQAQWAKELNRDPVATNNPMTLDEIKAMAPAIDWEFFFGTARIGGREVYVVKQPSYFEGLGEILVEYSQNTSTIKILQDYTTFKTIHSYASVLGEEWFLTRFAFSSALTGANEPEPLWNRAISTMNNYMGELLGQLYVERHFKVEAKQRMDTMIQYLIKAYNKSITEVDWMDPVTKQEALTKLHKLNTKIGFPDKWIDYSDLSIVGDSLVTNMKSAANFSAFREIQKLDKPVDKTEWGMTPQDVNAYYRAAWNEIVFPAAILQPPFFNVDADDAVNYGAIGTVIGHEIGHAFDDRGSQYDGDGVLRNWWQNETRTEFLKRADALAAQYDSYVVMDNVTINGQYTSGENLADLSGLSIAHLAYKMSLADFTSNGGGGDGGPVIDGWTADQRFFFGYAQVWRAKYRPEALLLRLHTGMHSPQEFRVKGAVVNVDAFYDAFDVTKDDGLYLPPEERVYIWRST